MDARDFYYSATKLLNKGEIKEAFVGFKKARMAFLAEHPNQSPMNSIHMEAYDFPIEFLEELKLDSVDPVEAKKEFEERGLARTRSLMCGELIDKLHDTTNSVKQSAAGEFGKGINLDIELSHLNSARENLEKRHDALMKYALPKSHAKRIKSRKNLWKTQRLLKG